MHDMSELQEMSSRLRRIDAGERLVNVYPKCKGDILCADAQWTNDRVHTSEGFLYYFDETPLTVEALVRGCTVDTQTFGHRTLFFRGFHVRLAEKWEWFLSSMEPIPAELQPRTVGDLRQLIYRLERDEVK